MKKNHLAIGAFSFTLALGASLQAQNNFTNNLVGHYLLDGSANDSSGHGMHGYPCNVRYGEDRFGRADSAAIFDGSTSYIYVTNFFANQPTKLTYSIWFKPGRDVTIDSPTFQLAGSTAGELDGGGDISVGIHRPQRVGANGPVIGDDGFGLYKYVPTAQYHFCTVTNFTFSSNAWRNVIAVFDENSMTLYLDGEFKNQIAYPTSPRQTLRSLQLGAHKYWYDAGIRYQYDGLIDDVRIYDKVLSAEEVRNLYEYESKPIVRLIKAVKPAFSNLSVGKIYQLQVSENMADWTNQGQTFPATNNSMVYPGYWDVENWGKLFFRLVNVP